SCLAGCRRSKRVSMGTQRVLLHITPCGRLWRLVASRAPAYSGRRLPLIPIEPGSGSLGVLLGVSPQEHRPRDAGDSAAMDSRLVFPTMPQHEAPGHGQVIAKIAHWCRKVRAIEVLGLHEPLSVRSFHPLSFPQGEGVWEPFLIHLTALIMAPATPGCLWTLPPHFSSSGTRRAWIPP